MLFRNQQLKRLKEEILDLEDFDNTINLSDFSLDEFRLDLLHYLEANRAQLEEAGIGHYAVVPPKSDIPAAQPGALFCLRQKNTDSTENKSINPLSPHYLVFVHDDSTVRFTFTQPKECLNLFRALASGETSAIQALCAIFDKKTEDGQNMSHYSNLLKNAIASIVHTFQKRTAAIITRDRDFTIPTTTSQPVDDFELVSYLVIMKPEEVPDLPSMDALKETIVSHKADFVSLKSTRNLPTTLI